MEEKKAVSEQKTDSAQDTAKRVQSASVLKEFKVTVSSIEDVSGKKDTYRVKFREKDKSWAGDQLIMEMPSSTASKMLGKTLNVTVRW